MSENLRNNTLDHLAVPKAKMIFWQAASSLFDAIPQNDGQKVVRERGVFRFRRALAKAFFDGIKFGHEASFEAMSKIAWDESAFWKVSVQGKGLLRYIPFDCVGSDLNKP